MNNALIAPPELQKPAEQIKQLQRLGFAVANVPGYYLADTLARFQAANNLVTDAEFGPMTQKAMFQNGTATGSLIARTLIVAAAMVGVKEVPAGSNRGPQIEEILRSVGLGGGYAWCAAFLYWCFREASRQLGVKNPCPKNAGVLNMWDLASYPESGLKRITAAEAKANPALIKPGMQFILDLGKRQGHTGIVEKVGANNLLTTIEGNTNLELSREGIGVFRLNRRTITSINKGFIVYE